MTPKYIVGKISQRYIAGTRLQDAVVQIRDLNTKSMMATVDLLGEHITRKEEALAVKQAILGIFSEIKEKNLNSNVSIKPTQLGLIIDPDFCLANFKEIADAARAPDNFVRIDMEDSSTTDATLTLYRQLRSAGYDNVGVVIQSYMKRSEHDILQLAAFSANVRLCKGIYIEPAAIAFKGYEEVRQNYLRLLRLLVENKMYVGIATHDNYLVEQAYKFITEHQLEPSRYEFQMLLGVKEQLRNAIVSKRHRLRVYVPYGEQWYAYCVRRLRENPQIAGYVLKAMFSN
jgi:proline dehydrogenase